MHVHAKRAAPPRSTMLALLVALFLWPLPAWAQYRNHSIGFDFSYLQILKPSVLAGGALLDPGARGDRLTYGLRLGGEYNVKLHRDHWWLSTRLNLLDVAFRRPGFNNADQAAETLAALNLGFNMGLEGMLGLRYYWLTDRFRPYLQVSLGYMHIFSFGSQASAACADTGGFGLCNTANGDTYSDDLMPRRNFMPLHVSPSFEVIVARDVALHFILDYSRWIVFRGRGNNVFTLGFGGTFFG